MDLKAMREKLQNLANGNKGGNNVLFKPVEGENNIRVVPLKATPDNPFQELYWHYLGGKSILSPRTYGEKDPIADFSDALVGEGGLSKDDYKAAKKFSPQLRTYLPVVVRGKENEGVKFWAFGKTTLERILNIIADEDYGDITDIKEGFDLKVMFTPQEKSDTGFAKTEVTPRRKSSPLSENPEVVNQLLNEQPNLVETFKKWTAPELQEFLEKYLNPPAAGSSGPAPTAAAAPASTEGQWASDSATPAQTTQPAKVTQDVEDDFNKIFNS
jgi:hypothetical protein